MDTCLPSGCLRGRGFLGLPVSPRATSATCPRLRGTRCSLVKPKEAARRRTEPRGVSWGDLATILAQGRLILPSSLRLLPIHFLPPATRKW
jgi:hypothetical protein